MRLGERRECVDRKIAMRGFLSEAVSSSGVLETHQYDLRRGSIYLIPSGCAAHTMTHTISGVS